MSDSNNDALWQELKVKWNMLKKGSGASDAEKASAKTRICEIQKALGKPVQVWDDNKKSSPRIVTRYDASNEKEMQAVPREVDNKVMWPTHDVNQEEFHNFMKVQSTAFIIAKTQHPSMDINGNTFGTIVSSITGHLINLRRA